MTQQSLEKSEHGYDKIRITTLWVKGNLIAGCQRLDVDVYPAADIHPDRFVLTIGIAESAGSDYNKKNEKPTSFRTGHISKIDEIIESLILAKIKLAKLRGIYRREMISQDLANVYKAYKEANM